MRRWMVWFGLCLASLPPLAVVAYRSLLPPSLPVPPQGHLTLVDVAVRGAHGALTTHQTIEIDSGRVVSLRPFSSGDGAAACPGCVVMPGLTDAHVHLPPRIALGNQELFALLFLAAGVTTVRDVGESDGSIPGLADRLNRGDLVGPRVVRCGPVIDGPTATFRDARRVISREEGRRVGDSLASAGVRCLKVYNGLSVEAFAGVREAATVHGLKLIGHVPHEVGLREVADFEAQHLTGVPSAGRTFPPRSADFADTEFIALSAPDLDTAVSLHVRNRISILPTLANARLRLIASDPARFPATAGAQDLPAFWGPAWNGTTVAAHPEGDIAIRHRLARIERGRSITRRLFDAGVPVLAGTDVTMPWMIPGESLLLEIDALAAALGSVDAALTAATTNNARALGDSALAVIAPGSRANLLVLPRDPSPDLSALREWRLLVVDGRQYERATVDEWVRRYRSHFRSPWYERVMALGLALTQPSYRKTPAQPTKTSKR